MYIAKRNKARGNPCYYLTESARVNGKPRIIWQKYLGTAESLKKKLEQFEKENIEVHSKAFGSVACILSIADELNFHEIINKCVEDKNYKLSVWQHLLIQSICRFNEPISKDKSLDWYNHSILPLLWKKKFSSSQTILNQFDKLIGTDVNTCSKIEEKLVQELLSKGIKPSALIWDPTNFYTYIEKSKDLAKKGNSKEKRFDRNLINLGLVVSDENIPLFHNVYAGNIHETKVFTNVVDSIFERLKKFKQNTDDLVFVFDKGNNSDRNIGSIKGHNIIGALKSNQIPKLYDVSLSEFKALYKNKKKHEIKGYRTKKKVYGQEYTIVVTYNEQTYKKNKKKTEEAVKKIKTKFKEVEQSIKNYRKGKKATLKGISTRIGEFLHKQYAALFNWDFNEKEYTFSWEYNKVAYEKREKSFGKTILFTNMHKKSSVNIAKTYNSKSIVEDDFKLLKNRLHISVKPIFLHDDNHIKAHIFICVLTMTFYRYMLWKLKNLKLSEAKINEEIKNMRISFLKIKGSNSVKPVLEKMTPEQIKIFNVLGLDRYFPY